MKDCTSEVAGEVLLKIGKDGFYVLGEAEARNDVNPEHGDHEEELEGAAVEEDEAPVVRVQRGIGLSGIRLIINKMKYSIRL